MVKVPAGQRPSFGSCASSGHTWRLWAARYSQGEPRPLSAQPLPRVLELAASKVADSTAFDHSGTAQDARRRAQQGGAGLGRLLGGALTCTLLSLPTRRHGSGGGHTVSTMGVRLIAPHPPSVCSEKFLSF